MSAVGNFIVMFVVFFGSPYALFVIIVFVIMYVHCSFSDDVKDPYGD